MPHGDLGRFLRQVRERARLTQADLGLKIARHENYVWQIEAGHRRPFWKTVVRWCEVVDASEEERDHAILFLAAEMPKLAGLLEVWRGASAPRGKRPAQSPRQGKPTRGARAAAPPRPVDEARAVTTPRPRPVGALRLRRPSYRTWRRVDPLVA